MCVDFRSRVTRVKVLNSNYVRLHDMRRLWGALVSSLFAYTLALPFKYWGDLRTTTIRVIIFNMNI